jgi:hypothetical protein
MPSPTRSRCSVSLDTARWWHARLAGASAQIAARSRLGKLIPLALLATLALVPAPASASSRAAQQAIGAGAVPFSPFGPLTFVFDVRSGPRGEHPVGFGTFVPAAESRFEGRPTCLSVSGHRASIFFAAVDGDLEGEGLLIVVADRGPTRPGVPPADAVVYTWQLDQPSINPCVSPNAPAMDGAVVGGRLTYGFISVRKRR